VALFNLRIGTNMIERRSIYTAILKVFGRVCVRKFLEKKKSAAPGWINSNGTHGLHPSAPQASEPKYSPRTTEWFVGENWKLTISFGLAEIEFGWKALFPSFPTVTM
jgi:hypothetical protein